MACACSHSEYSIIYGEEVEIHMIKWTFNGIYFFIHKKLCTKKCSSAIGPANLADKVFHLAIEIVSNNDNKYIELSFTVVEPVTVLEYNWKCFDVTIGSEMGCLLSPVRHTWTKTVNYITEFLKDGVFIFNFSFRIKKCKCHLIISNENFLSNNSLINDFEKLLSGEVSSDVTVKSSEGKELRAHRLILASRSAVFKAHFDHNTTECHTNVVESPLESEVLTEVLTFIYSDKAPRVDEIPKKLLAAADYYQLTRLKTLSENSLIKKLTAENAIETLQTADLYSADSLKSATLKFIRRNSQAVLKSDKWKKLQLPELIRDMFECITIHSD